MIVVCCKGDFSCVDGARGVKVISWVYSGVWRVVKEWRKIPWENSDVKSCGNVGANIVREVRYMEGKGGVKAGHRGTCQVCGGQ